MTDPLSEKIKELLSSHDLSSEKELKKLVKALVALVEKEKSESRSYGYAIATDRFERDNGKYIKIGEAIKELAEEITAEEDY